jgi:hypothetical protein
MSAYNTDALFHLGFSKNKAPFKCQNINLLMLRGKDEKRKKRQPMPRNFGKNAFVYKNDRC